MGWFNYFGLAVMAVVMIPNIVYAAVQKDAAVDRYRNKAAYLAEQIGRYGCTVFMIFNIPYTYFDFEFDNAAYRLFVFKRHTVPCVFDILANIT